MFRLTPTPPTMNPPSPPPPAPPPNPRMSNSRPQRGGEPLDYTEWPSDEEDDLELSRVSNQRLESEETTSSSHNNLSLRRSNRLSNTSNTSSSTTSFPTCGPCSEPQGLSRATKVHPYPNSIPYKNEPLTIDNRVFGEVATVYLNQFFLFLHSYGFDTNRFLDALKTHHVQQRNLDAITALRLGAAEMGHIKKEDAAAFVMAVWPDKQGGDKGGDKQATVNPHNIMCLFSTTIRMVKVRLSCEASDLIERGSDDISNSSHASFATLLNMITNQQ